MSRYYKADNKTAKTQKIPKLSDHEKTFVYHNTFWGGSDSNGVLILSRYARTFRKVMPFYVINNVFKGVYVRSSQGDGTVMYINMARLNVTFEYYINSSSGEKDSIVSGVATFSSTKEVLQVNRFNNENLKPLADDNSCTYLKTPAGLFTEVELPISEIKEQTDTLNTVRIIFTRYNQENSSKFGYSTPTYLLMVRKGEMYDFFSKNKLSDNITSFVTNFDSSSNEYTYSNISRLINYCANEYEKGCTEDADWESKNPDWNKVVLIPVTSTKDSNGNIVGITHDL